MKTEKVLFNNEKNVYLAPQINVVEVVVEKGFQCTDGTGKQKGNQDGDADC